MKKSVTLAQIAKACETSIGTVSRAINGKSDINEETRARILRVAYEMGYRSNKIPEFGKLYRIGIVYCKSTPAFHNEITDGIKNAAKKWYDSGIRVDILQTETLDQKSQLDLLNSLNIDKYDALVINSAGRQTSEFIQELRSKNFPVATFNTDAAASGRLFYIGEDSYASGYLGAGLLAKFTGGVGKLAVYGSFTTSESWKDRLSGFCSVFEKEYPDVELVPVFKYSESIADSKETVKKLVERYPDLIGLFPTNSTTTRGTLLALEELNRHDIHVVGYDLSPESRKGLMNSRCDAILYQNPYLQGYLAVKLMAKYLLYGSIPTKEQAIIRTEIITKYNLVWWTSC